MSLKLSPEHLVVKYINSATNGKVLSIRLGRLLTLIVFPLWIVSLAWAGIMTFEGIKSINKSKALEQSIRFERKNNSHYDYNRSTFVAETPYLEMLENKLRGERDKKNLIYYLPVCIVILLFIPWIVLRLIYWVVDSDKSKLVK